MLETGTCGAVRDWLPCILDGGHDGTHHQDVNGYQWPTAEPAACGRAAATGEQCPDHAEGDEPIPYPPSQAQAPAVDQDDARPALDQLAAFIEQQGHPSTLARRFAAALLARHARELAEQAGQ
ncbi:hypothetical protein [Streptomyces sp. 891-h]|uniref:hypothetical protein n=1 Tax=unclassified Streptomyces TaxID=2593676 RepID=UPI001FA99BB2|nr:hypothetical protein [Streptomyces sp. 891-h]UNZ18888.1 hypothetical protein HC362_19400 [Streptomyces sp. 891-h]